MKTKAETPEKPFDFFAESKRNLASELRRLTPEYEREHPGKFHQALAVMQYAAAQLKAIREKPQFAELYLRELNNCGSNPEVTC